MLGVTITDATFDILQGIAAIRNEEYTHLSASMLVIATWLGVGEEVIEGMFEIGTIVCLECVEEMGDGSRWVRWIVDVIIHIGGIVELSMGIYIVTTFQESVFMYVALGIQCLFLLIARCWMCGTIYFAKNDVWHFVGNHN